MAYLHNMTMHVQYARQESLSWTCKTTYSSLVGNVNKVAGLLPKGEIMGNIYIGADGVPIEQNDDGAFYVTQEKVEDSKEFEEIMNGPTEAN
jgi:hypothetical protein